MGVPNSADFKVVRGTHSYTKRYEVTDAGVEISFPVDMVEWLLHYEGSTVIAQRKGTVEGSETVNVTSDGTWEMFPIYAEAGRVVQTVYAPTGTTIYVSVTGWR